MNFKYHIYNKSDYKLDYKLHVFYFACFYYDYHNYYDSWL